MFIVAIRYTNNDFKHSTDIESIYFAILNPHLSLVHIFQFVIIVTFNFQFMTMIADSENEENKTIDRKAPEMLKNRL